MSRPDPHPSHDTEIGPARPDEVASLPEIERRAAALFPDSVLPAALAAFVAKKAEIDAMLARLAPLRSFILPAGSRLSTQLHVCRTVSRRAERIAVDSYREMIRALGDSDPTTRRMLEDILATVSANDNMNIEIFADTTIANATVNNLSHQYFVVAYCCGQFQAVQGVRIHYLE